MSAFFELRTYKVFPGKMKEWIKFMENEIIPAGLNMDFLTPLFEIGENIFCFQI